MKKFISLALVFLMSLSLLIACSGPTEDPSVTTPPSDDAQTTPPTSDVTDNAITSDVSKGNFNGDTIKILAWKDAENIEFEYEDGNIDQSSINEAILVRNTNVQNRLNCTLEFIYTPGNYNNQQNFVTKAEAFANGDEGEFIDIIASYSMTTALASTKGLCANLLKYQNKDGGLNFEHPWWPDTLIKEAMFDDMLFVCTGDISTNLLWMMETMYFNKDLLEDHYGSEATNDLYKLVEDGKWTLDKLYEYCTDIYSDENHNQKSDIGDIFGYGVSWSGYYDDFYVGAGFRVCERNTDGDLVLSPNWGGESETNFVDTFIDFTYSSDFIYSSDVETAFTSGQILFTNGRAKFAKTAREKADIDYGILPMPKLNEIQENYSTNLGFPYTLYSLSSTSTKLETAAVVLESMAAQSYAEITPVLFEDALKLRYSPEEKASMVFDILRETTCFDVGRIYTTSLKDQSWSIFRNSVTSGTTRYSTKIVAGRKVVEPLLAQLIKDLEKAGSQQ